MAVDPHTCAQGSIPRSCGAAAQRPLGRDALERIRELRESELIDWVCLQIEIATNLEKGIQGMRPRKNGPSFPVLLEFAANAKRKALAVLQWARAGEKEGVLTVNS